MPPAPHPGHDGPGQARHDGRRVTVFCSNDYLAWPAPGRDGRLQVPARAAAASSAEPPAHQPWAALSGRWGRPATLVSSGYSQLFSLDRAQPGDRAQTTRSTTRASSTACACPGPADHPAHGVAPTDGGRGSWPWKPGTAWTATEPTWTATVAECLALRRRGPRRRRPWLRGGRGRLQGVSDSSPAPWARPSGSGAFVGLVLTPGSSGRSFIFTTSLPKSAGSLVCASPMRSAGSAWPRGPPPPPLIPRRHPALGRIYRPHRARPPGDASGTTLLGGLPGPWDPPADRARGTEAPSPDLVREARRRDIDRLVEALAAILRWSLRPTTTISVPSANRKKETARPACMASSPRRRREVVPCTCSDRF
jgi:hypothetical protein